MVYLTIRQALHHFCTNLSPKFLSNEAQSLFFVTMNVGFGYSKTELLVQYEKQLLQNEWEYLNRVIERLLNDEPIQYILGKTFFYDMPFDCKPGVLIPRIETEELVRLIVSEHSAHNHLTIVDIGTGSGCIPICLAKHLPNSSVASIDVSQQCIETAKQNAIYNDENIQFINADILHQTILFTDVDIIVSNPPYVLESEKAVMNANVLNYEPHLALFVSDNDPLLFYRVIIEKAKTWLKPNGHLYFEINEKFGNEIVALALNQGFSSAVCIKDLFEKDRFVKINVI